MGSEVDPPHCALSVDLLVLALLVLDPSAVKQDVALLSAVAVPTPLELLVSMLPKVLLAQGRAYSHAEASSFAVMPHAAINGPHYHVVTLNA